MRSLSHQSTRLLGTVTRKALQPTTVGQRRRFHPPPVLPTTVPSDAFISEPEPPQYPDGIPSRTEIVETLREIGVAHEITANQWVRTRCAECGEEDLALISPVTARVHCTACGTTDSFSAFETKMRIREKNEKKEDRRTTEEAKAVEESVSSTLDAAAIEDMDLYDDVSQLALVDQQEKKLTKKREERAERIRRIMDGEETLSSRDALEPVERILSLSSASTIKNIWDTSTPISEVYRKGKTTELKELQKRLGMETISMDTLSRFNMRVHFNSDNNPSLAFPRYRGAVSRERVPHGIKLIRRANEKLEKENYPGDELRFTGMFGLQLAKLSDRKIVVATNERDALAVYEASRQLTVSLPKGEQLDEQVIPYLEDFDSIYLWFPHRHLDYARDYANLLNASRCYLIKKVFRPIELLRRNRIGEIRRIIKEDSIQVRNPGFKSLTDIRGDIKQEIINSKPRMQGMAQWKRFDTLNRYLMGFRPGELTVLTGQTGVGKTTFLCEYSLDLCVQGVRTLFCSFEMPDEKILRWILVQYAGPSSYLPYSLLPYPFCFCRVPLEKVQNHHLLEQWLDRFERKGSFTLLKKHEFRDKNIKEIFEAIKTHVIATGTQHVIIDNLQFLVGMSLMNDEGASSFDRFNVQDRLVGMLRRLATDHGVHVTLVVHPRKTESDTDLDVQHVGGTARVTQEADNVLAIQVHGIHTVVRSGMLVISLSKLYTGRVVQNDKLELLYKPATYSFNMVDLSK
ncbi:hypothetical protein PMAYCL1PPCAC_00638, partial [Pristionchus mayeri]